MNTRQVQQTVLIIGAGPAGLTATHELLSRGREQFRVVVLEASEAEQSYHEGAAS